MTSSVSSNPSPTPKKERADYLRLSPRRQHQDLGVLVQKLREAQVAHPLLRELVGGDQLQALHLTEVGGVPHPWNVWCVVYLDVLLMKETTYYVFVGVFIST